MLKSFIVLAPILGIDAQVNVLDFCHDFIGLFSPLFIKKLQTLLGVPKKHEGRRISNPLQNNEKGETNLKPILILL